MPLNLTINSNLIISFICVSVQVSMLTESEIFKPHRILSQSRAKIGSFEEASQDNARFIDINE